MDRPFVLLRRFLRFIDNIPIWKKLLITPVISLLVFGIVLSTLLQSFLDDQGSEVRLAALTRVWIEPLADCELLATRLQADMFRLTSFGLMGADAKILGTIATAIHRDDARLNILLRDPPGLVEAPSVRAGLLASFADYRRESTNAVANLLANPGWGATTARNAAISLDAVIALTDRMKWMGISQVNAEIRNRMALRVRILWRLLIAIALGGIAVTPIKVLIGWRISVPLRRLTAAMTRLAERQYDQEIPAAELRDEIGSMARAVQVFKEGLIQADAVAAEEQATRNFLNTVLENLPIPVVVVDLKTQVCVLMNPACERLLCVKREDILGKCEIDGWPTQLMAISGACRRAIAPADGMVMEQDIVIFPYSSQERLTNITRLVVAGSDGKPHYAIKLIEDITERRQAERRLAHMAQYDSLTQLPNRVLFAERLAEAIRHTEDDGSNVAVLALDLDRFKEVNDTLGHAAGDMLLCTVTKRLQRCLRDGDTLARLGGDEFAVIQCRVRSQSDAETLALRLIECVKDPVDINGQKVFVGLSAGVTLSDPAVGAAELVQQADLALYDAKQAGRGGFRFFLPRLSARLHERRIMEQNLRSALERSQLKLLYQPSVALETRTIAGTEALMRWHLPGFGVVPPTTFIPLAEETGLIGPLGLWLLNEACREAASWALPIRIAVNVSPVQFRQPGFASHVRDALAQSGLAASRLELEITEGVLMRDTSETLAILSELRDIGVRIVLDDFGTGYASLAYLQTFRFDKLKVDRSFVQNLETDPTALAIMRAVLGLSESLNMTSTAEGVEQENQLNLLQVLGCSEAQGYLFWRPMPAAALRQLLAKSAAPALGKPPKTAKLLPIAS
jgi:diguanylate cyclase (GGDEF)-like protein/PAS domain S-box-containing protein